MRARAIVIAILFLSSVLPLSSADSHEPVNIFVDWNDDNAYILTGDVNLSQVNVTHLKNGNAQDVGLIYDTTGEDLRLVLNTTLGFGDEITITVGLVSRQITVGLWGQPLADHEVTLNSQWTMDQNWINENGSQQYLLVFNGQGWQQNIGNTLESWERGNGTLYILSNTGDGGLTLDLDLASVWKNETIVDGILTGQVFDARGAGTIGVTGDSDQGDLQIEGTVSDAWINRSMANEIVDEWFRLEANGTIGIHSDEDNETFDLNGTLAVLLIETWDSNGTRRFDFRQYEGAADLEIRNDDITLDISLDTFENLEKWEEGVRTDQLNHLVGHGTFGIAGNDNNSSIRVNGTIYDFNQKTEDGLTTIDNLHVDGVISGDAQGTFGVVRNIESSGSQANDTGTLFDVVVIHQEDWLNITGVNGFPSDRFEAGATHNESWSYDAVQADWDNRTIRRVWSQTGPDPSSGDELVADSPLQIDPVAPEVEEALGDVQVSRESGFTPIDAVSGDVFVLSAQNEMTLTVTTGESQLVAMDGHLVDTVAWSGVYSNGVTGNATGNLINDGPLSGLNVQVQRILQMPFGDEGATVELTENQSVNRVLSPSIISADDNSAPTITSTTLREGVVFDEDGAPANLEVTVADVDFNIESVEADLIALGGGVISLNDKGLNGDRIIGDDIWTSIVSVPGLEQGQLPINITITDAFDAIATGSTDVEVRNQPPRLLSFTAVPTIISRGEMMIINAEIFDGHGVSSVEIDLREQGGELTPLQKVGDIWIGELIIPDSISPGEHLLEVRLTDDLGAAITVSQTQKSLHHHLASPDDEELTITILNTPPQIEIGEIREIIVGEDDVEYTLEVLVVDADGLFFVKAKLGIFAPPGQENDWVGMSHSGNGIYTVTFTVRSGVSLGNYNVLVKARDSFGMDTAEESIRVTVKEPDSPFTGSTESSSNLFTYLAMGGLFIVLVTVAVFYIRRGGDGESGSGLGGFGDA
jgi:hypothetical protein